MSEVKWIKITTDIFENEKIKLIESMPQGYVILTVWFKILCLAGKQNNKGVFKKNKFVFTKKDLSVLFNMKFSLVSKALEVLSEFNMICFIDGVITIPNWEKYQNIEGMDKIREQNRQRKSLQRDRKKQDIFEDVSRDSHVTVTQNVTQCHTTEEEREEDIEEDIEEDGEEERGKERRKVTLEQVAGLFVELCPSLGTVTGLNGGRHTVLVEALSRFSLDDFRRCFSMAEASPFLCGENDRHWRASFDWLIDPNNMTKVLSGNYTAYTSSNKSYDVVEFWDAAVQKGEKLLSEKQNSS